MFLCAHPPQSGDSRKRGEKGGPWCFFIVKKKKHGNSSLARQNKRTCPLSHPSVLCRNSNRRREEEDKNKWGGCGSFLLLCLIWSTIKLTGCVFLYSAPNNLPGSHALHPAMTPFFLSPPVTRMRISISIYLLCVVQKCMCWIGAVSLAFHSIDNYWSCEIRWLFVAVVSWCLLRRIN